MPSFEANALLPASTDVAALTVLLLLIPLMMIFTWRAKRGKPLAVRAISAYTRLRQLMSQATESGRPIHVGMGSGLVGSEATPEVLMGITTFDYVARHAAAGDQAVLGTTADGTILAASQGTLYAARREAGFGDRYIGQELNFYGPEPFAYAAGAWDAFQRRKHSANVLLGRFGSEGLWLAEAATGQGVAELGGTSDPAAAALMNIALDEMVIGEEVYAAGAYLHRPSHLGSLAAQDMIRLIVILAILVGVVITSLGYWA